MSASTLRPSAGRFSAIPPIKMQEGYNMASIYKQRDGWQACASFAGARKKKNFATEGLQKTGKKY